MVKVIEEGASLSTLRKLNVRRTLDLLRGKEVVSRAELTKLCGVSAPTMSKLLNSLLEAGLIEEEYHEPEGKGRPSKVYRLAGDTAKVIGVIVAPDNCEMFTAGIAGSIDKASRRIFSTPDTYEDLLELIGLYIREFKRSISVDFKGVGVCVPGLINQCKQQVELSPNLHFLDGTTPSVDIERQIGLSTILIHEEHALCLAEKFMGNAKHDDDFAVMDISGGIGIGIFCNGKYLHGGQGFGGEVGHVTVKIDGPLCGCGNNGCLETLAGDKALTEAVAEKTGSDISMEQIIESVKNGTLDINKELSRTIDYLSVGLAMVINTFNPSKVFIYGRMFELADDLFDQVLQRVEKRALSPSFANCSISRTRVSRSIGTIVAVNNHIFEAVGPTIS